MTRVVQVYSHQARKRINSVVRRVEAGAMLPSRPAVQTQQPLKRVRVANLTASDYQQGMCIEYRDSLIDPNINLSDFQNYVGSVGVVPESVEDMSFGLVETVIPASYTGFLVIEGVVLTQVTFVHDSHKYAEPVLGSTQLRSTSTPTNVRITAVETVPGVLPAADIWAYVLLLSQPVGPSVGFSTFSWGVTGPAGGTDIGLQPSGTSVDNSIIQDGNVIRFLRGGTYSIVFVPLVSYDLPNAADGPADVIYFDDYYVRVVNSRLGVVADNYVTLLRGADSSVAAPVGGDYQAQMGSTAACPLNNTMTVLPGDELSVLLDAGSSYVVSGIMILERHEQMDKAVSP